MSCPVYLCRLCDSEFHEVLEVIDIFSTEGKQLKVAAKIFFVMYVLVSENDPTSNYVCRPCFGQVEVNVRFIHKSLLTHYKYIENSKNSSKSLYLQELSTLMEMPILSLVYRNFSSLDDLPGIYETFIQIVKSSNYRTQPLKNRILLFDEILQYNKNSTSKLKGKSEKTDSPQPPVNNPCTNGINGTDSESNTRLNLVKSKKPWSVKPLICNNTKKNLTDLLNKRNQKNKNKTKPNLINNVESNFVKPNQNKAIDKVEVICLDDDDSNDDTIEIQPIKKKVGHKYSNHFNNSIKIKKIDVPAQNISNSSNILNFIRKLVPSTDCLSTNSRTEEMTVTPDMPLPNIDVGLISSHIGPAYYNNKIYPVDQVPDRPAQVTPETGFHFLFSTEQTVDLTDSDNLQQKQRRPAKYKRKNKNPENLNEPPKKMSKESLIIPTSSKTTNEMMQLSTSRTISKEQKISKQSLIVPASSETTDEKMLPSTSKTNAKEQPIKIIPKPRPKRASAIASSNPELKNSNARKLNKHFYGEWRVHLVQLCVPLYTCSICKTIFADVKYRIEHEKKHILPAKFIRNSINQTVSAIEDTINTEQQEFLGYFNLVKQIHLNVSAMDQLATRKNLLKSLKRIGNVIGSYSCHYCEYKTTRLFILWAHMSSCHIPLYSEKKCGAYCFLCNRVLGKRSKLLKHLDNCTMNQNEDETKITEKLSCDFCDEDITSIAHLEKHLMNHVTSENEDS